jgi:hypothetical protein
VLLLEVVCCHSGERGGGRARKMIGIEGGYGRGVFHGNGRVLICK